MWVRVCNQTRSSVSQVLLMVFGHIFADKLLQVGNAGFVIISMLNYYGPVDASIEKPFKAGVTWIRGDLFGNPPYRMLTLPICFVQVIPGEKATLYTKTIIDLPRCQSHSRHDCMLVCDCVKVYVCISVGGFK